MIGSHRCRVCEKVAPGRTIPVLLPRQPFEDFYLCKTCWRLLECGFRQTEPDGALEPSLDGPGIRLTEQQLRSLIEIGLQDDSDIAVTLEARADLRRRCLVRGELRKIDADLQDAMAASAGGDWAAALMAVRMIQGRAVVTRGALEPMLGSYPVVADLPPLVRAVHAVGRVITDREVDDLAPDELRARMHAVLQAIDLELQIFLEPPGEAPGRVDPDSDVHVGERSSLESP